MTCLNINQAQGTDFLQEYVQGVPEGLCCSVGGIGGRGDVSSSQSLFPEPRSRPADGIPQDIAFSMLEGDFMVRVIG